MTVLRYLKIAVSSISDICSNKNQNKLAQPQLFSLFLDFEGTNHGTLTNFILYESLNTQLFWARRTRAWHHHGGTRPTSHKMFDNFSEVMDAKWGWWNKKTNTSCQISLSQDPKNHWLLIRILLNHEKMIVWNASY